ncbi:MAG: right-handed parallel beta-helix repeat-containing protein [Sedimentisphaerales bacterium]|nr:right-handed parallel beta-helix repeat-containing protein [Sedimentisphaerales bacterium]
MQAKRQLVSIIILILLFTWSNNLSADTIYVNGVCGDDAWTGTNPGCSAPNGPKATIQAGIDAASGGDTVIVADGTYNGTGNRDIEFFGKAITVQSENGMNNCIIDCQGTSVDPHRGFNFQNYETNSSILDGFTITNGYIDTEQDGGAGIRCDTSSPTIQNCKFINNYCDNSVYARGGGILIINSSDAIVTNCIFEDNEARDGGGVYLGRDTNPTVRDCRFSNNHSNGGWAGAISILSDSAAIEHCIMENNTGYRGAGIYIQSDYTILDSCTIIGNTSNNYGGGICCEKAGFVRIQNCIINGNSAVIGGAICCYAGGDVVAPEMEIINSTFHDNRASSFCGGIYIYDCPSAYITNNIITNNANGGGLYCSSSTFTISYNNVWNNSAMNYQGDAAPGVGDISVDPLFTDPGYWDGSDWAHGDYQLPSYSPCVDSATNSPTGGLPDYDYDENSRPLDGDRNGQAIADMGAYEYVPVIDTWHIDTINGNDNNDGLSRETAFATINQGIEDANNYDVIVIWPGVYEEEVNFLGKPVTVTSAADAAVIEAVSGYGVSFINVEGPDSVLSNVVIRNCYAGINVLGGVPTIKNVTVVNNDHGVIAEVGATPTITNSIFWDNTYGDLVDCEADYSWVQDEMGDIYEGLVGYWGFDEAGGSIAWDYSGNGHHGTMYGATRTAGKINSALSLDGIDDYVEMEGYKGIGGALPRSITAWVKIDPSVNDHCHIVSWGTEQNRRRWIFLVQYYYGTDGTLQVGLKDANSYGSTPVNDGNWHQVAVTFSGDTATVDDIIFYVDGVIDPIGFTHNTGSIDTALDANVSIGHYQLNGENFFEGQIDDVCIYNRVLSADEIEILYTIGLAGNHLDVPLFADPANRDYHLMSDQGRFYPEDPSDPNMFGPLDGLWAMDLLTSPCIDAGNPDENPSNERTPNGGRVNIGAYGGTAYASMSLWPLQQDGNRDGIVNLEDFVMLAQEWLSSLPWVE